MFKMLKVHKDTHKAIKTRASKNGMSIIEYMDYVVSEEEQSADGNGFFDVEKANNETLLAIFQDIMIELSKRNLSKDEEFEFKNSIDNF